MEKIINTIKPIYEKLGYKKLIICAAALVAIITVILVLAIPKSNSDTKDNAQSTSYSDTSSSTDSPIVPITKTYWEKALYVDDFGDPVGGSYVRGMFDGNYTSSTTSSLTTYIFDTNDGRITFRFFINDISKPVLYPNDTYIVKIKIGETADTYITSDVDLNDDIFIDDKDFYNTVTTALLEGKDVRCIVDSTTLNQKFSFTLESEGYSEAKQYP